MTDPLKIIGANGDRRKNDFYPTPKEVTVALVDFLQDHNLIKKGDLVWEPACGNNAIVNVLNEMKINTLGTDIKTGQDFLTYQMDIPFGWIITNPPFSLAEEFIRKSIDTDFIAAHNSMVTEYEYKYDAWNGEFRLLPVYKEVRYLDTYKVQYEITYSDGTTKNEWREVDKPTYETALKKLGKNSEETVEVPNNG